MSVSKAPVIVDQKYRDNWGDIFGKKPVKSKKIDDGYGEKPYDELEEIPEESHESEEAELSVGTDDE